MGTIMKAVAFTCFAIGALTDPGHTSRVAALIIVGFTLTILAHIYDGIIEKRRAYADKKRLYESRWES